MQRFLQLKGAFRAQPYAVQAIWASLWLAVIFALWERQWPLAFVALATFGASVAPLVLVRRLGVRLPMPFIVGIVAFIYATIFLGEAFDFYHRYAWWDVVMHGGSALGFGLMGFLFVFMLFEGDRYAAPAWAMGFMAFCVAVTIGAVWEIFEFAMDQAFGLNMQKSGLMDTMGDLIVDVVGGGFGAACGFLFLKGRELGGFTNVLGQFVMLNRDRFRRLRGSRRRARRGE
ncbi:hypothetical protein V8J36_10235 [Frigidibacter sp. MR17.14]|uniref:hypothetical protein n=1 Tax=Frigidibacter sp. MR17.14 TaxID=3126509 RepID=UPI003012EAA2